MRLLLVEDDRQLADWVAMVLRRDHYIVDCVGDGEDADYVLRNQTYDVVILDLGLPGLSGSGVLKRLRARGQAVPVLILTAVGTVASRVAGLDAGADDYLAKPFDVLELEARIRALLRRGAEIKAATISFGCLHFDRDGRQFHLAGHPLTLTPREFLVLEALIAKAGSTVTRTALFEGVFGFEDMAHPNAIEIYVHRVRKKLDVCSGGEHAVGIVTFRGVGYALTRQGT